MDLRGTDINNCIFRWWQVGFIAVFWVIMMLAQKHLNFNKRWGMKYTSEQFEYLFHLITWFIVSWYYCIFLVAC